MNLSKLNQLIREAAFDDMARNRAMEYGKQRAKRMAGEFSRNKIPDSIIEEAVVRGHRSELDPLVGLQRDVEIAKALSEGDLSALIDLYSQTDSQQARAAIEQMVVESGDINKLYSLNKSSGNRFMEKDIKKEEEYKKRKRDFAEKLQKDIDEMQEMSGMSGLQGDMMGNDIRDALITDRIKTKQTFLGDIDMLINNPDVSVEEIASHPRYKKWLGDEVRRLKRKRGVSSRPRNSKYAMQEELLEEASRLDDEIKELLSINDEYSADQLLKQRNRLIDRAWSMEDRTDDVDYLFKETPREEEFHKPFFNPVEKTGGKQNDPKVVAQRQKKLVDEAAKAKENDSIGIVRGGKKISKNKKRFLKEMYENIVPKPNKIGEEKISYFDLDTKEMLDKLKNRAQSAARKEKSYTDFLLGISDNELAGFLVGRRNKKYDEITDKAREFARTHAKRDTMTISNKIPTETGKTKGSMEQKATEAFIKRAARQRGFGIGSRSSTMERLLRMTRQQVIDYLDNIQDPYVKPNK